MKYIEKIRKFMYGRYGPDDLYHFLFKLYIVFLIIDLFVESKFLGVIELLIVVIMFYRFFSKKIYKRSDENRAFIKFKSKFLKPFKTLKQKSLKKLNNIIDKNYIYKRCNKCNTVLRLPLSDKYGIKHVKCPKCKKRLTVFAFKKEKIEVIKNERGRRKK